jgi:hypothetical protein
MTDTVVALVRKQFGGAQPLMPKALVRLHLHAEAVKQRPLSAPTYGSKVFSMTATWRAA